MTYFGDPFKDQMWEEANGIRKALERIADALETQKPDSVNVTVKTKEADSENDSWSTHITGVIGEFIEDCVLLTGKYDDLVERPYLFIVYQKWCKRKGIANVMDSIRFGKALSAAGLESTPWRNYEGHMVRISRGVKLKALWA